jgi:hypothetical protein
MFGIESIGVIWSLHGMGKLWTVRFICRNWCFGAVKSMKAVLGLSRKM